MKKKFKEIIETYHFRKYLYQFIEESYKTEYLGFS